MPRVRTSAKKLSKTRDLRRALVRTLATNLVYEKSITTTRSRAKTVIPYVERLVSRAKRGQLHHRRYVRSRLDTVEATHELFDVIAPQMKRDSGFLRIKTAGSKVGDGTPIVRVSFVDEISDKVVSKPVESVKTAQSPKNKSVKKVLKKL